MTPTPPSGEESPDQELLDVALGAAREAAALQREQAGALDSGQWSEKGTSDFVTEVDRESERRIVARIRAAFPDDRILAEEGSGDDPRDGVGHADGRPPTGETGRGGDARLWIVDPLDGTTNWLHGYPEYAVSIAALDSGGLRLGVVVNSATGETFTALRGRGARLDDRPIEVSRVSELRLALLGTGFPFKRTELIPDYLRVLGRMLRTTSGVRRGGSAALDLCDVACGRLDGFWEHWLMPWDVAAGALIVREAGGTFGGLAEAGAGDALGSSGGGEPTLEAAARRGEAIARAFAGNAGVESDPVISTEGAAFTAGNGRIDAALGKRLEESLGD